MPSICTWFSNAHLKPGSWELNTSCIYFHIIWLLCQHFHSCPVSGCLQPSYKIRLSCPRPPLCCSTPHLSKWQPYPFHSLGWNCLSHPQLLSFYHNSYPVYEHSCWISRLTIPRHLHSHPPGPNGSCLCSGFLQLPPSWTLGLCYFPFLV